MSLLVQFNVAANWVLLFSSTYTATPVGLGRYVPIGFAILPVLSDERILAARVTSSDAQPHWRTGGWLTPILDLSATPVKDARWGQMCVPLRTPGILILPEFVQSYRLRFDAPKWLKHVHLEIWQYIGPIDDSTEKLIRDLFANGGGGGGGPNALQGPTILGPDTIVDGGTI